MQAVDRCVAVLSVWPQALPTRKRWQIPPWRPRRGILYLRFSINGGAMNFPRNLLKSPTSQGIQVSSPLSTRTRTFEEVKSTVNPTIRYPLIEEESRSFERTVMSVSDWMDVTNVQSTTSICQLKPGSRKCKDLRRYEDANFSHPLALVLLNSSLPRSFSRRSFVDESRRPQVTIEVSITSEDSVDGVLDMK